MFAAGCGRWNRENPRPTRDSVSGRAGWGRETGSPEGGGEPAALTGSLEAGGPLAPQAGALRPCPASGRAERAFSGLGSRRHAPQNRISPVPRARGGLLPLPPKPRLPPDGLPGPAGRLRGAPASGKWRRPGRERPLASRGGSAWPPRSPALRGDRCEAAFSGTGGRGENAHPPGRANRCKGRRTIQRDTWNKKIKEIGPPRGVALGGRVSPLAHVLPASSQIPGRAGSPRCAPTCTSRRRRRPACGPCSTRSSCTRCGRATRPTRGRTRS